MTPAKPGKKTPQRQRAAQYPQYGQSVLNNAKLEIEQLDQIVDQLKYQLQVLNLATIRLLFEGV